MWGELRHLRMSSKSMHLTPDFAFVFFCFRTQYPDRESNSELSFRRALLYPFNYQGGCFSAAKVRRKRELAKLCGNYFQKSRYSASMRTKSGRASG